MNLQYPPRQPRTQAKHTGTPVVFDDPALVTRVAADIAAKNAEKAIAVAQLETACAAHVREIYNQNALNLGTIADQTGTIQTLVQQITRLEAELEFLARAQTGLGG